MAVQLGYNYNDIIIIILAWNHGIIGIFWEIQLGYSGIYMELELGSVLIWDLLGRSNQLNQKPVSWDSPANSYEI